MGPRQVFQSLIILVSSISGPKISFRNLGGFQNGPKSSIVSEIEYLGELLFWAQDMFQIMKLGELQCGPKHCFGNLGELQNGPKMYSSYQIWENSKKGPMARVVSEIEYLGELLSGPKICFRY